MGQPKGYKPSDAHRAALAKAGRAAWAARVPKAGQCWRCCRPTQTVQKQKLWCSDNCAFMAKRDRGYYDRKATCACCGQAFASRPSRNRVWSICCSRRCITRHARGLGPPPS